MLLLAACTGSSSDADSGRPSARSDADEYAAVADELAGYRSKAFSDEADELASRENRLFWLTFPGYDPVLHSQEGDEVVEYAFSIGSDTYNYRGSTGLIVTASAHGGGVTYSAYDVHAPDTLVGTTELANPADGSRWHPYAVDGTTAYIVELGSKETALYRWEPPAEPVKEWSFDQLGYKLGEFWDFDVEGDTMIFLESGRIWRCDVATGVGEWLHNETQISGSIAYDDEGVVWSADDGLYWYDYDKPGKAVDLGARIDGSDYVFNKTYSTIHHVGGSGFARVHDHFVYEAYAGIYLYDLGTGDFTPIILDDPHASDVRVTWRSPVLLDDGTLYVTGLESTSGSVGADGPVWKVEHPALMGGG